MQYREALIQFFEEQIPFNRHLGIRVDLLDPGHCVLRLPFAESLVGDPFRRALHGGVLSTIADAAGGLAVFAEVDSVLARVSTVDLRVDYLRKGLEEELFCEANVLRLGNRVAVTAMTLRQQGGTYVVAEGRGVYNVIRPEEPKDGS